MRDESAAERKIRERIEAVEPTCSHFYGHDSFGDHYSQCAKCGEDKNQKRREKN